MTSEQIQEQIATLHKVTKEITRSKKAAKEFLIAAGIIAAEPKRNTKMKK